jgi:hypothetical protein
VGILLGQFREDISSAVESRGLALGASADADLVLTRFAEQAGAPPRRVGYRLREGTVQYLLWPQGLDAGPPAAAYAVLANVADLRLTALREDGTWVPVWPAGQALPRAVAVELALTSGERVSRLFPLK